MRAIPLVVQISKFLNSILCAGFREQRRDAASSPSLRSALTSIKPALTMVSTALRVAVSRRAAKHCPDFCLTSLEQSGAIFLQKQNALGRPALDDIAKGNVSVSSDEDACECVVCLADVRTKQGHSDRD
jgi:hypothetical protein